MNTDQPQIDLVSEALVECQGKLKSASMDATNPFFKSRYATLGAVIEASREALHGAGLAIQQTPTIVGDLVSVHTIIRHKSGQFLDGGCMSLNLDANDRNSDAQIAGGILTYLRRYAWSSVLGIYADDDDDGNKSPKGAIPRQTTIMSPPANKNASQSQPEAHKGTSEASVGPKYRLQTLNRLQAAPGQLQRPVIHHFLTTKGWILPNEQPEDWDLTKLPKTAEQFFALGEEIKEFEKRMREQATT